MNNDSITSVAPSGKSGIAKMSISSVKSSLVRKKNIATSSSSPSTSTTTQTSDRSNKSNPNNSNTVNVKKNTQNNNNNKKRKIEDVNNQSTSINSNGNNNNRKNNSASNSSNTTTNSNSNKKEKKEIRIIPVNSENNKRHNYSDYGIEDCGEDDIDSRPTVQQQQQRIKQEEWQRKNDMAARDTRKDIEVCEKIFISDIRKNQNDRSKVVKNLMIDGDVGVDCKVLMEGRSKKEVEFIFEGYGITKPIFSYDGETHFLYIKVNKSRKIEYVLEKSSKNIKATATTTTTNTTTTTITTTTTTTTSNISESMTSRMDEYGKGEEEEDDLFNMSDLFKPPKSTYKITLVSLMKLGDISICNGINATINHDNNSMFLDTDKLDVKLRDAELYMRNSNIVDFALTILEKSKFTMGNSLCISAAIVGNGTSIAEGIKVLQLLSCKIIERAKLYVLILEDIIGTDNLSVTQEDNAVFDYHPFQDESLSSLVMEFGAEMGLISRDSMAFQSRQSSQHGTSNTTRNGNETNSTRFDNTQNKDSRNSNAPYPSGVDVQIKEDQMQFCMEIGAGCKICLTNMVKTTNLPCGHMVYCFECVKTACLNGKQTGKWTCPMCRTKIDRATASLG